MASLTASFSVDVVGEVTGEVFKGSFTTKLILCHADQFRRDEIRRRLLGERPESPTGRTSNSADVFSEIMIHITEAPAWWKESDGMALYDDSVVAAVFDGIQAEKKKHLDALKEKAKAAKVELAK